MDTGLSPVPDDQRPSYGSYLNPFGNSHLDLAVDSTGLEQKLTSNHDKSCQIGAEIFLRRLLNKLYKQVNDLQPDELDDEFIYQSTITYADYLGMARYMNDKQMSCASLINMENILSKVMSSAVVRRPIHTSHLASLFTGSYLPNGGGISISLTSLHIHLLMVLAFVGSIAWFFNTKLGVRIWRSMFLSFLLVGFVEFCMHKNELNMKHRRNLERCKYPSAIARLASLVSYDYDNCHSEAHGPASSIPNIAFTGVEYLSELVFQPLVHMGEKVGLALQSYLNSFTGFNYLLAPFFPVVAVTVLCCIVPLAYALRSRQAAPHQRRSQTKSIKTPKKSNRLNNAIR